MFVESRASKASVGQPSYNFGDTPALVAAYFYSTRIEIGPLYGFDQNPAPDKVSSPRLNIGGLLVLPSASRDLDHMHTGSKVREVRIARTSARAVFRLACGRRHLPTFFDGLPVIGHGVCARGRR
jgi:hypothetical protein